MNKIYIIMVFSILFVSCQSSDSEYGPCGEFQMPIMDEINVNDIIYFSYPHLSEIAINSEDISLEITDIKRKVSKPSECTEATLTDDSQDGDATQLTKGTKIYQQNITILLSEWWLKLKKIRIDYMRLFKTRVPRLLVNFIKLKI